MSVRKRAIRYVNHLRAEHELPKLQWDRRLQPGARAHSREMIAGGNGVYHTPDDQLVSGFNSALGNGGWNLAGENVGSSPMEGPNPLHNFFELFRKSKTHRRNMLGKSYDHIGVGVARSETGDLYLTYWFADE